MSSDLISVSGTEGEQGGSDNQRGKVHDEAKTFVFSLCLLDVVLLITACTLQVDELKAIGKPLALIPLIFMDSVTFYFKWYFLLFFCKKSVLLEVLTLLFDLCFWVTTFLCLTTIKISLLYTLIPIGLSIIVSLALYKEESSELKVFLKVIYKQCKIILKWVGLLTVLFVGLKAENLINVSWNAVLWPVWIALLALALKSINILGYLTGVIAVSGIINTANHNISSILWTLFSTLGCAISCTITLYLVIKQRFNLSYLPVIIFLAIFELFTLLLFNQIVEFITECFYTGPVQNPEIQNSARIDLNESLDNDEENPWKRHFKFIKRISSTYFKPVTESASVQIETSEINDRVKTKSCEIILTSESDDEKNYCITEKNCLVCLNLPSNSVLIPCGHGGLCSQCAEILLKTHKSCHICRGKIKKILKIRSRKAKLATIESIIT